MIGLVFKNIIIWILEQYTPFENIMWNIVLVFIIGSVAYELSFKIVGEQYKMGMIHGSLTGSICHWVIRVFIVLVLMAAFSIIIAIVKFIISIPWWIWLTIAIVLIVCVILWFLYSKGKIKVFKRKTKSKSTEEQPEESMIKLD